MTEALPESARPVSEDEVRAYLLDRRSLAPDRLAAVIAAVYNPNAPAHALAAPLCELGDCAAPADWQERLSYSLRRDGRAISATETPMTAAARDLLKRLTDHYQPPPHLAMNPRARAAVLADYEQALAGFDATTLGQAWQRIVAHHTGWCWPSCGELVKAAEFFSPRRRVKSDEEQRREKAQHMAEEYTARFLEKFHVAKLARQEGWLEPLKAYVEAVAWAQAQLIAGVREIGWDPTLLMPHSLAQGTSQELFDAWRSIDTVQKAVARKIIRVEVPGLRIQAWKAQCRTQAKATATNGHAAASPSARPAGPACDLPW